MRARRPVDLAVRLVGDLQVVVVLARVDGRQQVLAAVLDPLHRPARQLRQHAARDLLGEQVPLDAEAAADVGRDDADAVLRHLQRVGEARAHEVRDLRRRPDRQLVVGRVVLRDAPAVLERDARAPVRDQVEVEHAVRLVEHPVGLADLEVALDEEVVLPAVVQADRARADRGADRVQHLERRVLDRDQVDGVLGDVAVVGDDRDHGLAHEPHPVDRQRRHGRWAATTGTSSCT